MLLHIAQIVASTEAEGPGRRFALWLQGCPLRCPGCCNPEMLPFSGGVPTSLDQLLADVERASNQHGIEGITLMGGEPFSHAEGAGQLAKQVQSRGLTVMAFSGYTIESLRKRKCKHVDLLLQHTDILVDGPYRQEMPDTTRRWIGSSNQRIHFLSDRYSERDSCWSEKDTLEIRMNDGEVAINGFPARQAVGLWKRD